MYGKAEAMRPGEKEKVCKMLLVSKKCFLTSGIFDLPTVLILKNLSPLLNNTRKLLIN